MTIPTIDISEARKQISRLSERLRDDHVIWVTKHNSKAFAAVNAETMEALIETLEVLRDPDAIRMLQKSLDDIRMGRVYDHDDIKSELLQ